MGRCVYSWVALALSAMACVEPVAPAAGEPPDAGPFLCTPITCTGCCRDNVCLGGNLDDACGYDGRECRTCESGTLCVSPGACVSQPRDGGFDTPLNLDSGFPVGLLGPARPFGHCLFRHGRLVCF